MDPKISIALSKDDWDMLVILLRRYEGAVENRTLLSWLVQTQQTIQAEISKPKPQPPRQSSIHSDDNLALNSWNPDWESSDDDPGDKYSDSEWWITHTQDDEF